MTALIIWHYYQDGKLQKSSSALFTETRSDRDPYRSLNEYLSEKPESPLPEGKAVIVHQVVIVEK